MNATTIDDLDAVTPGSDKIKVRNVALLTPQMTETLLTLSDLSAKNVLLQLVKLFKTWENTELTNLASIKDTVLEPTNPTAPAAPAVPTQDQCDAVRAETVLNFRDTLLTLWKIAYKPDQVTAVPYIPIDAADKLHTIQSSLGLSAMHSQPTVPTQNNTNNPNPPPTDRWSTLDKMAEAWQQDVARKVQREADSTDKRKTAWKNLLDLQKTTVLLASTKNNMTAITEPTDCLLTTIASGSGPRAKEYLHHLLQLDGCFVNLDDGFCCSLKTCCLLSQSNEQHIQNFSPGFCPPGDPTINKSESIDSARYAEQAINGKFSAEDFLAITKQTISFPKSYNTLAHTFKNFASLASLLFGPDSILALSLTELVQHIKQFKLQYTKCFHQNWWFGGALIDRINVRVQLLLCSAALGDPARLNIAALDWHDMLNRIVLNEFYANIPWWLDNVDNRKRQGATQSNPNKRQRGGDNNSNGGDVLNNDNFTIVYVYRTS